MNIDKRAKIESQVFLAPSDDKIHNNPIPEADVEDSKTGNCFNGDLPFNFTSMVMTNAYNDILPAPLMPSPQPHRKPCQNYSLSRSLRRTASTYRSITWI